MKKVDELLGDLRRRKFHIDCVQMELVRASDGKRFEGPGYIRQKPTRDFEIKMYADGKIDFREVFEGWGSKDAGVLYGAHDHFSLTATDEGHRRWRAERIINPEPSGYVGREGYVVSADCQEVVLVEERWAEEYGNSVRLQSLDPLKFPRTSSTEATLKVGETRQMTTSRRNVAEVECHGLKFCFEEDDGVAVLVSAGEGKLHPHLEWRVTEAITFALGVMPAWALMIRAEGKERVSKFRSHERRARKAPQWPPYRIEVIDRSGSVWRMFNLTLGYVLADRTSDTHPLARSVNGVSQTRSSSAEGQALAVAVAVESVLDRFFGSFGAPEEKLITSVDELVAHIRSWGGDKKIIERAMGAIGGLKRSRADDRLRALVAAGIVGEDERQAWKKLRNTAAHGDWHKYDENLQELLDLTGKVLGLFNQLVFHLIGYAGKQTDYGTHGWSTVDYPPKPVVALVPTKTRRAE